ncbi:MAG TPA: 3-isopropylmalate dehydratase small subunit [Candidatus Binatia bacterium]|nr:3-isopropylmalate dehydratase small subunit [Candidatus Binatia bacterium]
MNDRVPFSAVRSAVIPLLRDDVDTDQIIPARYLKATGRDGFGDALFADWRYGPDGEALPEFVLNRPEMQGRHVLLVGRNFGCGSSREHAPWALRDWGVRAVIAAGFADIFRANALKVGLLPVELSPEHHAELVEALEREPDVTVTIDLELCQVELPDRRPIAFEVDPFARSMLLSGTDELGYLLSFEEAIAAHEAAHPAPISTIRPSG